MDWSCHQQEMIMMAAENMLLRAASIIVHVTGIQYGCRGGQQLHFCLGRLLGHINSSNPHNTTMPVKGAENAALENANKGVLVNAQA